MESFRGFIENVSMLRCCLKSQFSYGNPLAYLVSTSLLASHKEHSNILRMNIYLFIWCFLLFSSFSDVCMKKSVQTL